MKPQSSAPFSKDFHFNPFYQLTLLKGGGVLNYRMKNFWQTP
jgi:hypothetical protein